MANFYKHIVVVHGIAQRNRDQLYERVLPVPDGVHDTTVPSLCATIYIPLSRASKFTPIFFRMVAMSSSASRKTPFTGLVEGKAHVDYRSVAVLPWPPPRSGSSSSNLNAPAAEGIKDQIGWACGLVVTALIWKLHAAVHKGLVQLWRYGRGETNFSPRPAPQAAPAAAGAAVAGQAQPH